MNVVGALTMPQTMTTIYRLWTVDLDGNVYTIHAVLSKLTNTLRVQLNEREVWNNKRWVWLGDLCHFVDHGHTFVIRRAGALIMDFTLVVDGQEIDAQTSSRSVHGLAQPQPAAATLVQGATIGVPATVHLLREEHVRELTTVIDTETYPLDNRKGGQALSVEYEVSKTVSNEVAVQTVLEGSGTINADILSFLKAEIAARVSRQIGHTVGETVTRRQKLLLSVEAHGAVVYEIVWKRKVRTGTYIIAAHGVEQSVPYQVSYDLSYEVRTV